MARAGQPGAFGRYLREEVAPLLAPGDAAGLAGAAGGALGIPAPQGGVVHSLPRIIEADAAGKGVIDGQEAWTCLAGRSLAQGPKWVSAFCLIAASV